MNFIKSGWSYLSSSFTQSEDDANESTGDLLDTSQKTEEAKVDEAVDALVTDEWREPAGDDNNDDNDMAEFADAVEESVEDSDTRNISDDNAQPQTSSADSLEGSSESIEMSQAQYDFNMEPAVSNMEFPVSSGKAESEAKPTENTAVEREKDAQVTEKDVETTEEQPKQGYASLEASDSDDSGEFIPPPAVPFGRPVNTESQLNEIIKNLGGDLDILTLEEENHHEETSAGGETLFVTAFDQTLLPSSLGNDTAETDLTLQADTNFDGKTSPDSAIASSSRSSLCSVESIKLNTANLALLNTEENEDSATPLLAANDFNFGQPETSTEQSFAVSAKVEEQNTQRKTGPAESIQQSQEQTSPESTIKVTAEKLVPDSVSDIKIPEAESQPTPISESTTLIDTQQPDSILPEKHSAAPIEQVQNSQPEKEENLPFDVTTERKAMNDPADEIPLGRGAYTIDFDNLDNFNPFQSAKAICNSPDIPSQPFPGKEMVNQAPPEPETSLQEQSVTPAIENNHNSNIAVPDANDSAEPTSQNSAILEELPTKSSTQNENIDQIDVPSLKSEEKKEIESIVDQNSATELPAKTDEPPVTEDEPIPVARGSYNLDLDNLDKIDPFKTSKGLQNSPTKPKSGYAIDFENIGDVDPFKCSKTLSFSPPKSPVKNNVGLLKSMSNNEVPDVLPEPEKKKAIEDGDLVIKPAANELITIDAGLENVDPVPQKKLAKKPVLGANRKKVTKSVKKKPPPVKAPDPEPPADGEDDIIIPRGSYAINFDDLENMDPFKTSKGLSNSPTKTISGSSFAPNSPKINKEYVPPVEESPGKGSSVDPPNLPVKFEPPSMATDDAPSEDQAKSSIADEEDKSNVQKAPMKKKTGAVKKKANKPSPVKLPPSEPSNEEEGIPIPRGSYNLNFDDLDAMDPFKTSKGLANSPSETNAVDPFKPSKPMANSPPNSPTKSTKEENKALTNATEDLLKEDQAKSNDADDEKPIAQKVQTKKKTGAVKKKIKKPSPMKAPPPEPTNEEDEIPIPRGSYNLNFDDLDAMDPFKTSKGLPNSPTEKKAGYSVDFGNLTVDPFKPSKAMANSPPGSPTKAKSLVEEAVPNTDDKAPADIAVPKQDSVEQIKVESEQPKSEVEKKPASDKKPKKKTGGLARKKLMKPGLKKPLPDDDNASDEPPPLPKGAYNLDFDNMDAMDPFQSSKGLSNSPMKESAPPVSGYSLNFEDLDSMDPFKSKKTMMNSPPGSPKGNKTEEIKTEVSADSIVVDTAMREVTSVTSVDAVDEAFASANETVNLSSSVAPSETQAKDLESAPQPESQEQVSHSSQLQHREIEKMAEDEEFYPASSVFQDSASLAYLDKLGGGDKPLTASDLKKQSLYVKFDPLVSGSPLKLIEQQISQNNQAAGGDASNVVNEHKAQGDINTSQVLQAAGDSLTSAHVSTAMDHHSTSVDSFNRSYLSQQSYGSAPPSTLKYTQADFDAAVKKAEREWEMERKEKKMKEDTLRAELEQMSSVVKEYDRLFAEMSGNGSRNGMLTREQQLLKAEHEQSLEDMAALERSHEDLCRRYNRLKTMVAQFKQNEDILKKSTNEMMEEAQSTEKKYVALKKKADEEIKKAQDDLQSVKADAQQEVGRAQAQLKMLELKCESLQSQIRDCSRENEELTKLCDDLIACSRQNDDK